MALHAFATCLVALALVPTCSAAGTKVKAKAKDPWDVPDGSEEMEAAPMGDEMSPEDQAGMIQQVAARSAMRRANSQHAVMKQFMRSFANNMRLSVLADSKGDMPEEERQRLIAKAEAEKQEEGGGPPADGPGFGPPPAAESDDEMESPPPPPRPHRRHHAMLNMGAARAARRQRPHPRHRLLPEAEGIGFPAPEGMASDPSTDGMENDPGMSYEAPAQYDAPPAPRPRPHRHHLRMLNMRPGQGRKPPHHHASHARSEEHSLPSGVVRDEMGRAMPLLFTGSNPVHSGAIRTVNVAALAAASCLFFMVW